MVKKNPTNLLLIIKNLIKGHTKRLSDLFYLVTLEARLAGKSLVTLIIFLVLSLLLLGSTWVSLLFLIFFILRAFEFSAIVSISLLLCLNILLLIICGLYMRKVSQRLSFSATRRQIANLTMAKKEHHE